MTRVRKRRLTFLLEHGSCTGSSYDERASSVDGGATTSASSPSSVSPSTRMNHHCGAVNSLVLKSQVEISRRGSGNETKPSLFTASRDATIKRWQVNTEGNSEGVFGAAKLEMTFEGHVDWVNDVAVLGNTLVSCSNDCTVRLWKANANPRRDSRDNAADVADDYGLLSTLYEHSDYVMCVAAAEEAKSFVSAGLRSEIKLWDLGKTMKRSSINLGGSAGSAPSSPTPGSGSGLSSNKHDFLKEFDCASASDCSSCYACDINPSGVVLACGSTDGIVRIWDTRSNHANEEGGLLPQMSLRGHVGNIRCIKVNRAGTMCITGSSDKTLRIWDLGQQRCVHSFSVHKDSVWALDFDELHGQVVSGGRDGQVFCTNISNKMSTLLFEEDRPVLSVAAKSNRSSAIESVWSSTSSSSIHYWDMTQSSSREGEGESNGQSSRERRSSSFVASTSPFSIGKSNSFKMSKMKPKKVVPLQRSPSLTIVGVPAIIKHEILNNRQKILTEDTSGNICLWNVFTGSIEKQFTPEELGLSNIDKGLGGGEEEEEDGDVKEKTKEEKEQESPFNRLLQRINPEVTVSSWFSADKRLGKLSIHMEPKQCFSTEVYAVDLGIEEVSDELKFNVGQQVTCSLFGKWEQGYNNAQANHGEEGGESEDGSGASKRKEEKGDDGNKKKPSPSSSPSKTPKSPTKTKQVEWPFSFENNPCIITTTCSGEWFRKRINDLDGSETSEVIPEWVVSCVADAQLPAGLDLKFSFNLLPADDSDLPSLQQGKLLAPRILLVSKVLNYVANKLTEQNVDVVVNHGQSEQPRDKKGVDANDLELLCNGKLLTPEMSLAKVRQSVWKRSDDIAIQYRVKAS